MSNRDKACRDITRVLFSLLTLRSVGHKYLPSAKSYSPRQIFFYKSTNILFQVVISSRMFGEKAPSTFCKNILSCSDMCRGGGSRNSRLQAPGGHQEGNAKSGVSMSKLTILQINIKFRNARTVVSTDQVIKHLSVSEF